MGNSNPSYVELWQALNDIVRRTEIIGEVLDRKIENEEDPEIIEQLSCMRIVLLGFDAAIESPLAEFPGTPRNEEPVDRTLWAGEKGCN